MHFYYVALLLLTVLSYLDANSFFFVFDNTAGVTKMVLQWVFLVYFSSKLFLLLSEKNAQLMDHI